MATPTLTGSTFALARWFQPEQYANRPEDDFVREDILNDLATADAVGIDASGTILVRTEGGACAIDCDETTGLVHFDYVSNTAWTRTRFWMNAASVRDLGAALRALPRVPFDSLFVGGH